MILAYAFLVGQFLFELKTLPSPIYSIHHLPVYWIMMHFFLHGGRTWIVSEKNKQFFQTLCKHGNKILIFPFGGDSEEKECNEYTERFIRNNPNKQLVISYASHDIPQLIEQIKNNDILFFSWWKPYRHFEVINKIENFKNLIDNKIIAWTSWWAIMRAKSYYSSNAENYREGNWFLPVKVIAHRWSEINPWLSREEREKLLENYWEELPIYKIPEQEYIEFTI